YARRSSEESIFFSAKVNFISKTPFLRWGIALQLCYHIFGRMRRAKIFFHKKLVNAGEIRYNRPGRE
nr:hypothetical protein [Oscillospiraceae bacterium]